MTGLLKNNRGIALMITILVISLIMAVTLQFNRSMRVTVQASANIRDGVKLTYIAKSAVNAARAILMADAQNGKSDNLQEEWANLEMLTAFSGSVFEDGSRFGLQINDHSGRIQLNALILPGNDSVDAKENPDQIKILTDLLKLEDFGLEDEADALVDALLDWLDPDDDQRGLDGAENTYYQGLEEPYSCKNGSLESVEELLLVKGFTPEILYGGEDRAGIAQYLTPYGRDGKVNVNTAPPEVLMALDDGIDYELATQMVAYRDDEDNESSLEQVSWFKTFPGYIPQNGKIDQVISTTSSYFAVEAVGMRDVMQKKISVVLHRQGKDAQTELRTILWRVE